MERSPLPFPFTLAGPLRDCIFPSTRNHECACQIFEGDDDGTSRVNVSPVYASRKRRDGERRIPPGDFGPGSFSRRHAIVLPPLVLVDGTSRLSHHVGHEERDSAGPLREPARDAFQCKYLSPWGHGIIVAISCFSEIQPARLTSSLLRAFLLPYLALPPPPPVLDNSPSSTLECVNISLLTGKE